MDTQVLIALITSGVALSVGILNTIFQYKTNTNNHAMQKELEGMKSQFELEKIKLLDEFAIKAELRQRFHDFKESLNNLSYSLTQKYFHLESSWADGNYNKNVVQMREIMLEMLNVVLTNADQIDEISKSEFLSSIKSIEKILEDSLKKGTGGNLFQYIEGVAKKLTYLRLIIINLKIDQ